MISEPKAPSRPFAALWEKTRARLAPLGLNPLPLDGDLALAEGGQGKVRLRAARWGVGAGPQAECRIVRIQGAASEIVNVMIFPSDPGTLPVFAAELLVFGGCPRLAFLDLQCPGMIPDQKALVAAVTGRIRAIATTVPRLEPPFWAQAFSAGGFTFTRTADPDAAPELARLYLEYLDGWFALARVASAHSSPLTEALAELQRYKREHVRHSPGADYLARLFGASWTDRFLNHFLYG